jgi:hypothetical protein
VDETMLQHCCPPKAVNGYLEAISINPFKDEAQTALFKDPVGTAL